MSMWNPNFLTSAACSKIGLMRRTARYLYSPRLGGLQHYASMVLNLHTDHFCDKEMVYYSECKQLITQCFSWIEGYVMVHLYCISNIFILFENAALRTYSCAAKCGMHVQSYSDPVYQIPSSQPQHVLVSSEH